MELQRQIDIRQTRYDYLLKIAPSHKIPSYIVTIENFLGVDGLEALKRANPYGDPCGEIRTAKGYVLVTVEQDTLDIQFQSIDHHNNDIERTLHYLSLIHI